MDSVKNMRTQPCILLIGLMLAITTNLVGATPLETTHLGNHSYPSGFDIDDILFFGASFGPLSVLLVLFVVLSFCCGRRDPNSERLLSHPDDALIEEGLLDGQVPLYEFGTSSHIRCLLISLTTFACCYAGLIMLLILNMTEGQFLLYTSAGFFLIYLIDCCCASTSRYMFNARDTEGLLPYIEKMQASRPVLWMSVECYHYETRSRTCTETDSDGNTTTTTEYYEEKVTTYTEKIHFQYNYSRDESHGEIYGLERFPISKIKFRKSYEFANDQTVNAYNQQSEEFQSSNRWRDTYMDYSEGWSLPGYKKNMLIVNNEDGHDPIQLNYGVYILANMFLLSYPLRMWLEKNSVNTKYQFFKSISV
eukprot:TRINITY_DN9323_c0_g1_i1.p1 TRINITY_DN9323_c0_g1~~TRINITY_DN9323_c0_g1_i1.p1  ORF type:complete len:364 (-),score=32.48 TRINITY_DN9323_c0_g1_i1:46-1137(-)